MNTLTLGSSTPIPEFGIKRENEERRDGGCAVIFDPSTQLFAVGKHHENGFLRLFSGGVDPAEDLQEGILREVTEESGLYNFGHIEKIGEAYTHYYNTLRKVNRVALATCLLIVVKNSDAKPVHLEAHETFSLVWARSDEILENWKSRNENKDCDHWIYFLEKSITRLQELGYNMDYTK